MAGKNIDSAFAAIIKDCQAVAVEAVKNAAKRTQADIVKEANDYLQRYYANYPKPKKYKRTMNKHDYLISALNYIGANINNTTIRTAERILYRMSNTKISQNYDF